MDFYCTLSLCNEFNIHLFPKKIKKLKLLLATLILKELWVPYMEFRDFGHTAMIPICNWNFRNFFGGWEIQRAFQQAITCKILTLFAKVDIFFFFLSNEGILLATTIATESTQNNPKLQNFVKICPKTISLRKFEIPPKIKILTFFKKKSCM